MGAFGGYDEGWRVMGRRTVRWHTAAAVGAALTMTTAQPGPALAADGPAPYSYAENATAVDGSTGTSQAVRLSPGRTYRSAIGPGEKLYYRLDLDAGANAYVSGTAVPAPGASVASSDGLRVSIEDVDAHRCSYGNARFGPTRSAHPVTAWASREIGADEYMCQAAGAYYLVVERVGPSSNGASSGLSSGGSSGEPSGASSGGSSVSGGRGSGLEWGLELGYAWEPAVKKGGSTAAPEIWNSASPEPLRGDPERRRGGSGFASAGPLAQGIWQDRTGITAGETRYYKVPVGWGQQLSATVELGSTTSGEGYVGNALVMSLYNPARALVDDALVSYGGDQRSAALDPLPPVAYDNRYSLDDEVSGMRFAGWYYLAVHLGSAVADRFGEKPIGLTLRVRVSGRAGSGPGYLGQAEPRGVFEVTDQDREAAETGTGAGTETGDTRGGAGDAGGTGSGEESAAGSDGSTISGDRRLALTVVAAGGIGTGSLLVLTLLLWTVVARRRVAADRPTAPSGGGRASRRGRHGPSRGR
ncbi:hypothetical protein [Streptomyces sp. HM190]|uniref:hypothetical protein n=1 Tax=Streptomyces sp. HM190 TaxID=2695266 RepID=UPI001F279498|nr:hypothetical protein [Streptomyces sp. HM190]